jgi:aspartate/methionine/tyrosine aminotransferase
VYPPKTLRAINELCGSRGLFHVSDETYEYFAYDGIEQLSPGSLPGATPHTISLFSFSKAYGFASWRVGYMVFPAELREALRKIQDTNLICPPVVSQLAAIGCLRAGDSWVQSRVGEVAAVRRRVLDGLRELGDSVAPAQGAFYALLRLDLEEEPVAVARRLIVEHRVAALPGSAFGLDGCHLRIAYGALTPETAAEGIGRLVAGVRAMTKVQRAMR